MWGCKMYVYAQKSDLTKGCCGCLNCSSALCPVQRIFRMVPICSTPFSVPLRSTPASSWPRPPAASRHSQPLHHLGEGPPSWMSKVASKASPVAPLWSLWQRCPVPRQSPAATRHFHFHFHLPRSCQFHFQTGHGNGGSGHRWVLVRARTLK